MAKSIFRFTAHYCPTEDTFTVWTSAGDDLDITIYRMEGPPEVVGRTFRSPDERMFVEEWVRLTLGLPVERSNHNVRVRAVIDGKKQLSVVYQA